MTGLIVRTILVLMCLTDIVSAQTALMVAPYGGVTSTSASFRQLGEITLPPAAPGLSTSSGWTAGLTIGVDIRALPWLGIQPFVAGSTSTYGMTSEEPTTFSIGGVTTPGRIDHTYTLNGWDLTSGVMADVHILDRLYLSGGFGVSVPISLYGTHDETIAEPSGVTWLEGGTTRRAEEGSIPGLRPAPWITAGVRFPSTLAGLDMDLGIMYATTLGSITTAGYIRPSSVTATVRLHLPFAVAGSTSSASLNAPLPLPVLTRAFPEPSAPSLDTVLPIVRPPAITATCRVGFRSDDGALVSTSRVTLEHHLALVLTQHEGGAVRRTVDTITIADPPSLVITPTVFTDDEIADWNVEVALGDTVVRIAEGTGAPPGTITWECADLPEALLRSFVSDTVRVAFTARGRRGGAATAPPSVVRMQTTPRVRLVDTTAVRAVITGYTPNATPVPSWASSLMNELRQTVDELPTIRIIGMADGVGERSTNEVIARDRALAAAAALGVRRASIGTAPLIHSVYSADRSRERGVRIDLRRAQR